MPNGTTVVERLEKLRNKMKAEGINYCLITSSDPHGSEYVAPFFKVSEYFSGCTSDNVSLLIGESTANLWTDGRYFLSAQKELEGTGIVLMRSGEKGVLNVADYLKANLKNEMVLGYDGSCIPCERGDVFREISAKSGASVNAGFDPAAGIWEDRPKSPAGPVWILDECEEKAAEKINRLKADLLNAGATSALISRLDEIMYLTNLRGSDIPCNPVALSYFILKDGEAILYLQEGVCSDSVKDYLSDNGIVLKSYDAFFDDLRNETFEGGIFIDPSESSDRMVEILLSKGIRPVMGKNPIVRYKAVKTEAELAKIRECYLLDSAVLCSFLCKTQKEYGKEGRTEISLAKELDDMRSWIPGFLDLSFPTISAFKENAAIIHYEPNPESDKQIEGDGFYLVDSGAQYKSGTTDVTRTIPIGEISPAMKKDFTLVAIANLRLLFTSFLSGTTGVNLDMIARQPLWEHNVDYRHGTGHGIGFVLNVHEGPQNISWRSKKSAFSQDAPFEAGMITSIEPGIYRDGEYGIRTETIAECVALEENEYGKFLKFSPLTYVPICKDALDFEMMDSSDLERLNRYHIAVYEKISPLLTKDGEKEWLYEATKPVYFDFAIK